MVRILYPDGTTLEVGGIVTMAGEPGNGRIGRVMGTRIAEDGKSIYTEIAWHEGPIWSSLMTSDQVHALVPAPPAGADRIEWIRHTLPRLRIR